MRLLRRYLGALLVAAGIATRLLAQTAAPPTLTETQRLRVDLWARVRPCCNARPRRPWAP